MKRITLTDRTLQHCASRAAMLLVAAILALCGSMTMLTSCSDDETIYVPDPTDAPSTRPLVTVIYSPDALGDRSYNDLIYAGVESICNLYELRTMHLSPSTREEGLTYLEQIFRQMEAPGDTIRRLLLVASSDYDTWLRQNNKRLEGNPRADLLYFETSTPLEGKGSTFYMPYYGAMYEAGAITPHFYEKALLIGANPEDKHVREAMQGFTDGFAQEWIPKKAWAERHLTTMYIAQHAGEGYSISDSLALKMLKEYEELKFNDFDFLGYATAIAPVCGGASSVFMRMSLNLQKFIVMGIDVRADTPNSQYSVVKHIDGAVMESIGKWFNGEGMEKHRTLGLASGYTEMKLHLRQYRTATMSILNDPPSGELRQQIHEEAVRLEEEKMKNEE